LKSFFSSINDITVIFGCFGKATPVHEIREIAVVYCLARFYFNGQNFFAIDQETVNFLALAVSPKIGLGTLAVMEIGFYKFINNQILKERAFQVVRTDLVFMMDTEQRAGDTRVVEIEFW